MKRIIRKGNFLSVLTAAVLTASVFSGIIRAEGAPSILAMRPSSDGVYIYTAGDTISDMDVQIGDSLTTVEPVDNPIRTVFLIDNSISTYEALVKHGNVNNATRQASLEDALPGNIEGDSLVPFLRSIVDGREEGEQFRVGIFNDSINLFWACDWSTDYELVNNIISSVSYADNTTSVSDALYNTVASIPDDGIYTRIILISDCVDDGVLSRGYGEFAALEENKQVGIYVVGISRNNNSDDISNILELSRTAPRFASVTTTDGSNMSDLYGVLNGDHLIQGFVATPTGNVFTGGTYGVLVNMTTEFGEFTSTGSVVMPILPVTPTPIPTPTPTPSPVPSATPTPEPEEDDAEDVIEEPVEDDKFIHPMLGIVLIGVIFVGGGIAAWLFVTGGITKKNKKASSLAVVQEENSVTPVQEKKKKTLVSVFKEDKEKKSRSEIIDKAFFLTIKGGGGFESNSYNEIRFVNNQIVIGTDESCDLRINDGTLGARHCIISCRNGQYYLKDLGNANPIRYNGVVIENREMLINTGGVLDIGREQFKVDFKTEQINV